MRAPPRERSTTTQSNRRAPWASFAAHSTRLRTVRRGAVACSSEIGVVRLSRGSLMTVIGLRRDDVSAVREYRSHIFINAYAALSECGKFGAHCGLRPTAAKAGMS